MNRQNSVPSFAVVSGGQVQHSLQGRQKQIVELVESTYRLHCAGDRRRGSSRTKVPYPPIAIECPVSLPNLTLLDLSAFYHVFQQIQGLLLVHVGSDRDSRWLAKQLPLPESAGTEGWAVNNC
jgi:hypothetical protein